MKKKIGIAGRKNISKLEESLYVSVNLFSLGNGK